MISTITLPVMLYVYGKRHDCGVKHEIPSCHACGGGGDQDHDQPWAVMILGSPCTGKWQACPPTFPKLGVPVSLLGPPWGVYHAHGQLIGTPSQGNTWSQNQLTGEGLSSDKAPSCGSAWAPLLQPGAPSPLTSAPSLWNTWESWRALVSFWDWEHWSHV